MIRHVGFIELAHADDAGILPAGQPLELQQTQSRSVDAERVDDVTLKAIDSCSETPVAAHRLMSSALRSRSGWRAMFSTGCISFSGRHVDQNCSRIAFQAAKSAQRGVGPTLSTS
jgi:hypothetical protein